MSEQHWQQARNLLCIRLDYLGDVLMTTPALRALKEAVPGRRITLLTSSGGAAAARYIPEIDDVITYAAPWLKSSDTHDPQIDLAMIERLRADRYDGALIFTVYSQNPLPSAMMCYLAGIPLRAAHCRENPYQLLSDWVRDPEPQEHVRHEVRRQLDLAGATGARTANERMSFRVPPADAAWVRDLLPRLGVDASRPWIVMHPGASAPSRRYPPALWAQAARLIAERLRCPLLFTGGDSEAELVAQICSEVPGALSLAGRFDLGRLAALIEQAPLLVSNNTGPAHLAAALGTPVVDLYALTNPQHTPWQVPSRVLFEDVSCRFCYKSVCPQQHQRCLSGVSPARVAEAAFELLHLQPQSAPAPALESPLPLAC